ncbi:MAG: cytochrome c biosis protein, partial [Pseudomonadota bacterium]|nr:cytochrome c biosis protein [Pseudomonadota bacterium]
RQHRATHEGLHLRVFNRLHRQTRLTATQVVQLEQRAIEDAVLYPVPVVLMLDSFEQRQASVFQVTRTPGRNVVYLGCVLLIIGVFAMLYIRDRRVWVWLQQDSAGGTRVQMALSSTRQTLDTDREFEGLRQMVLGEAQIASIAKGM